MLILDPYMSGEGVHPIHVNIASTQPQSFVEDCFGAKARVIPFKVKHEPNGFFTLLNTGKVE